MFSYAVSLYLSVAVMASAVFIVLGIALWDIGRIGSEPVEPLCPWCDHDHRGEPCTIRLYIARHA